MKRSAVWLSLGLLACSAQVWAQDAGERADRGERIERRLDRHGDRIDNRLDRASKRAERRGRDVAAQRLDRRGDRVDRRLDRRGRQVNRRI